MESSVLNARAAALTSLPLGALPVNLRSLHTRLSMAFHTIQTQFLPASSSSITSPFATLHIADWLITSALILTRTQGGCSRHTSLLNGLASSQPPVLLSRQRHVDDAPPPHTLRRAPLVQTSRLHLALRYRASMFLPLRCLDSLLLPCQHPLLPLHCLRLLRPPMIRM